MKKLAILTIISSPAFAHLVPLNEPEILNITGGDTHRAAQIESICASHGKSIEDCKEMLGLTKQATNFQLKAAQYCSKSLIPEGLPPPKNDNGRADLVNGSYHFDYRKDDKGRLHRHDYSPELIEYAVTQHQANLIEASKKVKTELDGQYKRTESKGFLDSLTSSITGLFGGTTTKDTRKGLEWTSPTLSHEEYKSLMERGEKEARANPGVIGRNPDLVCFKDEKYCIGSKTPVANASYEDPKTKKGADADDNKSGSSESETKTASSNSESKDNSAAKSGSESKKNGNDVKHKFVGAYAGEPTPVTKPGEMIATSADPQAIGPSILEECITATAMLMQQKEGQMHRDEDAETEESKKERAEEILKAGFCDQDYFGLEFCNKWEQEQAEHKAQNAEREEEARRQEALDNLKWGVCDERILGFEFCREWKRQLDTTRIPDDTTIEGGTMWDPIISPPTSTAPSTDAVCELDVFGRCTDATPEPTWN